MDTVDENTTPITEEINLAEPTPQTQEVNEGEETPVTEEPTVVYTSFLDLITRATPVESDVTADQVYKRLELSEIPNAIYYTAHNAVHSRIDIGTSDAVFNVYCENQDKRYCTVYYNIEHKSLFLLDVEDIELVIKTLKDADYLNRQIPTSTIEKIYPVRSFISQMVAKLDTDLSNHDSNANQYSRKYIEELELKQVVKLKKDYLAKNVRRFKSKIDKLGLGIRDKYLEVVLDDVIAEDIQCDGEDIDLGTLTFGIDLPNNRVVILNGTQPRDNAYHNGGFHPHQVDDIEVCLGTMAIEMSDAINNLQLNLILILLKKFATSYNSRDSAGESYQAWTERGFRERMYCERYDTHYDEDDCEYSYQEDDYIPNGEAIWCEEADSYLWEDRSIETVNNVVYPHNSSDVTQINNAWYEIDSEMITNIDDTYYLLADCTYSDEEERYLGPGEDLVEHEDGFVSQVWYDENVNEEEE